MTSSRDPRLRGLYAITPRLADTEALCAKVSRCLAGGAALIQYRAKDIDPAIALGQALRLACACREAGALFIVNDSIDLARSCSADGVHLGRDDAGVAQARRALPRAVIGASCYDDPERAREAAADGADYVAIGSVFASPTKPGARRASLAHIAEAARISGLPVAAIGGIGLDNAAQVRDAGADMLAVIAAVFDAPDIEAAARGFALLFSDPAHKADARTQPRPV